MNSICSSIICLIFVFLSKHAANANALTKEELKALEDDLATMENFCKGFQGQVDLYDPTEGDGPPRTIYEDFCKRVYNGKKEVPLFKVNWKSWEKKRNFPPIPGQQPKIDDQNAILNHKKWAKFHHALDLRLFSIYVLKEDQMNKTDKIHAHFHLLPVITKKSDDASHHGSAAEKAEASHHGSAAAEKPEASHDGSTAEKAVVHSNKEITIYDLVEEITTVWEQFTHERGQTVDVFNDKFVWTNEKECLAAKNVKDNEFVKAYAPGGLWHMVKGITKTVVGKLSSKPLNHH